MALILVIDDDQRLGGVLREMLEEAGELILSGNGQFVYEHPTRTANDLARAVAKGVLAD